MNSFDSKDPSNSKHCGYLIVHFDRTIKSHKLPAHEDDSDNSLETMMVQTTDKFWYYGKIPTTSHEQHVITIPNNLLFVEKQHLTLNEWNEETWLSSVVNNSSVLQTQVHSQSFEPIEEELSEEEAIELAEQTLIEYSSKDDELETENSSSADFIEVNEVVMSKLATILPVRAKTTQ